MRDNVVYYEECAPPEPHRAPSTTTLFNKSHPKQCARSKHAGKSSNLVAITKSSPTVYFVSAGPGAAGGRRQLFHKVKSECRAALNFIKLGFGVFALPQSAPGARPGSRRAPNNFVKPLCRESRVERATNTANLIPQTHICQAGGRGAGRGVQLTQ